jgi:exodeoxyribonuclease-1
MALAEGLCERDFCAELNGLLSEPGTCAVGYNSLRFDDEFIRHTLFRNFHDPYEREWRHGNSRWDLLDLSRLLYALRPEGMNWPIREAGLPSFKLEHLAAANGITHARAHDALSDVEALIDLARTMRKAQPKLFDYYPRISAQSAHPVAAEYCRTHARPACLRSVLRSQRLRCHRGTAVYPS